MITAETWMDEGGGIVWSFSDGKHRHASVYCRRGGWDTSGCDSRDVLATAWWLPMDDERHAIDYVANRFCRKDWRVKASIRVVPG